MNKFFALLTILSVTVAPVSGQSGKTGANATLALMKRVGDWQLDHWQKQGMRWPAYDWVNAAGYTGIAALARVSGDSAYYRALYAIGEKLNWDTGPHRTMADDYCIGQTYTELYARYRDPRILAHFRSQCDSICLRPHTESLEWGNEIYLREWAWCDALFMGPPGLVDLSAVTGDRKYLVAAEELWWNTANYLYDPVERLFFRDSRYFHKQEANGQKMFWSRGNGWVMAGLVRMLAKMPERYPGRSKMIRIYTQMAARISTLQQPDGSWRTSLLDPAHYPALETSGTAFYCYALAWGINHGVLDRNSYLPVVRKAWAVLKNAVHPDGMLGFVQAIGEEPGATSESSTEAYGTGGFLLAGSEMLAIEEGR